jgi:two-component system, OmpR family, sensor histidine kinase ArlS
VKIQHKIMLLFTLLVTAIIALLAFSVYYFSFLERKIVFNKRLKSRANYSAEIYSLFGDSSNAVLSRINSTTSNGLLLNKSIAIFSTKGNILYQLDSTEPQLLPIDNEILGKTADKGESYFKIGNRDAIALMHRENANSFIVVVAAYDEDGLFRLDELLRILLISLFVSILITGVAGFIFSRRLLKPISQIIYEVNHISSYNLSHRIKAGSGKDELNQLATTFNELLERLQKSFDIQRSFISNASHELSTPLTSISSQLEVTLHKDRSIAEYQKVLLSINEDVLNMILLTKSLLEIAKADSQGNFELSRVRVDEILMKIASEIRVVNEKYNVELYFGDFPEDEKDCVVFGNLELLHSALKNIIENGCKYSTDHVAITNLYFENHFMFVSVTNKGSVIPAEEIKKIFQPFYRGSNVNRRKGFGLGLALAEGITRLHKGTIEVRSDIKKGTVFILKIPSYRKIELGN